MFSLTRWALIPVVSLLGWYLALVISMAIHKFAEFLCPKEFVVSGLCQADWFPVMSNSIIVFGAGLAAAFVVLFSTLIAPAKKTQVAWFVFVVGFLVAAFMAFQINAFAELSAAGIFGSITALALNKHFKQSA